MCGVSHCRCCRGSASKTIQPSVFPLECFRREPESRSQRRERSQTATAGGLTAGAVGAPPARLTVAGVGSHAAAVDAALGAVSWTERRQEDRPLMSTVTQRQTLLKKTSACRRKSPPL